MPSLNRLPNLIGELTILEELSLFNLDLTVLPSWIWNLKNLKILKIVHMYQLDSIPDAIGKLTRLEILDLSSVNLPSIPSSIGNLTNLKEISIENIDEVICFPDALLCSLFHNLVTCRLVCGRKIPPSLWLLVVAKAEDCARKRIFCDHRKVEEINYSLRDLDIMFHLLQEQSSYHSFAKGKQDHVLT